MPNCAVFCAYDLTLSEDCPDLHSVIGADRQAGRSLRSGSMRRRVFRSLGECGPDGAASCRCGHVLLPLPVEVQRCGQAAVN
jgi:hypothetical protein